MAETFDVEAARARCESATPGPWKQCAHLEKDPCGCGGNRGFIFSPSAGDSGHVCDMQHEEDRPEDKENSWFEGQPLPSRKQVIADAAFIAHARTDLPAALDEIERLRAEREAVDRLVEAAKACLKAYENADDAGLFADQTAAMRAALRAVEAARAK